MIISQKEFIKITAKTNGRCFYCNAFGEVIDHFVPKQLWQELEPLELGIGSPDRIENLFLACALCNSKKHDKLPSDFMGNFYKCWDRFYRTNQRIGLNI